MEVLLLKDIRRLGKAGEVRKVADGYARNYLIPRGLATPATAGAVREAEQRQKAQAKREAGEQAQAQMLAERISGTTLHFKARAGETGHLYGSITSANIAEELEKQIGASIDKRKIMLSEPIREVGTFPVTIRFGGDVSAEIQVSVEAE